MAIAYIKLEHPETAKIVELRVQYTYIPEELPSIDCPGAPADIELWNVIDQDAKGYLDESMFTDEQIIQQIKELENVNS